MPTYQLFLALILLASCKKQNQTSSPENNKIPVTSEAINNLPPFAEMETPPPTNQAPNTITRNIIQDKKGTIWFATFEGVIKYERDSFTNVTKDISQSRFFSILEDSNGNFWFGSIGEGVYFYDGKTFKNFTTKEGLVENRVTNIYEDKKGNLWFGTIGGISCYNGKSFRNFTSEQGLPDIDVNSIIEDRTGKFWIGTRGSACTYDGQTFTTITNNEGKVFSNIRHIIEAKNGNIWLGGNVGLWRYDGEEFINFTKDFVGYVYEDKAGNIWTSSHSTKTMGWALSRYDVAFLDNEKWTVTEIKTGEGMFFGILEDSDGNIWSGTLDGIYRYDGNTFENFKR